jgi:hypothetical protein
MRRTLIRTVVAAAVAATALTPLAGSASANDGDVERTGRCTQSGRYDLKASPENRGIEVEFEVDVNRRGHQYRVRMFHDGRQYKQGVYRTRGRSGSFTVRDVEPDRRGKDGFRVRAVRLGAGGQVCGGQLRF